MHCFAVLDILQFPIPMNSGGKGLEGSLVSIIIGYHTCIVVVYFYSNTLDNPAYIHNRYYLYYIYINIHIHACIVHTYITCLLTRKRLSAWSVRKAGLLAPTMTTSKSVRQSSPSSWLALCSAAKYSVVGRDQGRNVGLEYT